MENLKEAGQKVLGSNKDLLTCEFGACESLTVNLSRKEGTSNKQEMVAMRQSQTSGSFEEDLVLPVGRICNNSYLSHLREDVKIP